MSREQIRKTQFHIAGKRIEVYPSPESDSAVVYVNTFAEEGDKVYQALCSSQQPEMESRYGTLGYSFSLRKRYSLHRRR